MMERHRDLAGLFWPSPLVEFCPSLLHRQFEVKTFLTPSALVALDSDISLEPARNSSGELRGIGNWKRNGRKNFLLERFGLWFMYIELRQKSEQGFSFTR